MSFPKKYNPKEKEQEIRQFWEENNVYAFDENSSKPVFSIDTPPPTVSGRMHIGHAFSYAQTDFIARYKRMRGFNVFYPFGTDDNGLATEKLVQKEEKLNLREMSREEAKKTTLNYLEKARPEFIQDWKNIGISADFNLYYSTIDNHSQTISQKSFLDLYQKGLVKQKEGPIPWDRVFETAIAQAELEDVTRTSHLNYIKAKLSNTQNTYMIYATTRPELCFAVVGMSVEDEGKYVKLKVGDEYWITGASTYEEKFQGFNFEIVDYLKGQDLIGLKAHIPVVEKEVEITHDISVKADFGTGIAYFCTFGGVEDIEWINRHNVEPIEILDRKGKLSEVSQKYDGMLAEDARKEIIKELEETEVLVKKEEKEQIVNVGERSGAEVEYIVSKQWYVTYLDKKEYFFEMCEKFNWYPEFMKHRLENWIDGLNWDWGFSRQRHFGIPIPVWYDREGNVYLPKVDELPVDPINDRPKSAPEGVELIPETDVFDTWFTSASSPFLSTQLVEDSSLRDKLIPMDMRPQAHDIINFWLFYTMAKTNLLYNMNPFDNVVVSGWMLDPHGRKMSKSKGNSIAPQDVVENYSNDALRYLASASKLGYDMPYQEKEVQTGVKVANKIFNACKFADMLLESFSREDRQYDYSSLKTIDKWLLSKTSRVLEKATNSFDNFDYSKAKAEIDLFFMRDVADNYIEIAKQRLWNPDTFGEDTKKAQYTLYTALFSAIRGFAPFIPYITEEVYQNFFSKYEDEISIHLTSWPESVQEHIDDELEKAGEHMINIITAVRKFKSEQQVSQKTPLSTLVIECDEDTKRFIEDSIGDLKAVTGAKSVEFGKGEQETESQDINITPHLEKEE